MTGNSHLEEGRASLQPPPQAAGSKAALSTLLTQPQQRRAATYQLHTGQRPGRSPTVPNGHQRPAREKPPHTRAPTPHSRSPPPPQLQSASPRLRALPVGACPRPVPGSRLPSEPRRRPPAHPRPRMRPPGLPSRAAGSRCRGSRRPGRGAGPPAGIKGRQDGGGAREAAEGRGEAP